MTHDTPDETQRFRSSHGAGETTATENVIDITEKLRETARTLLGESDSDTAERSPASNVTTVAFGARDARAARSDDDPRGVERSHQAAEPARSVAAPVFPDHRDADRNADIPDNGDDSDIVQAGEAKLLSKLRSRQLSVKESRDFLIEYGVPEVDAEEILERFAEWEYLDDMKLAEQLEYSFGERKKLGASGVAREMAKRGIPRELIDERTQELRENDSETVFEVARDRARRLQHLDREVAERRLLAFLQRRGFNGSIARDATRAALSGSDVRGSSVRFE